MALSAADKAILKQAQVIIERELAKDGDKLIVYKLGTFRRVHQPARQIRQRNTSRVIEVPAKSVIKFTASERSTKTASVPANE
jgi:nucleoid DNA-binding protein